MGLKSNSRVVGLNKQISLMFLNLGCILLMEFEPLCRLWEEKFVLMEEKLAVRQ